jgi:hypothetical protein
MLYVHILPIIALFGWFIMKKNNKILTTCGKDFKKYDFNLNIVQYIQ